MFPLPCFSVPSQTADPVRVAIVFPPLIVDRSRFAPDASERNALFDLQQCSGAWGKRRTKMKKALAAASASTTMPLQVRRCHSWGRAGRVFVQRAGPVFARARCSG